MRSEHTLLTEKGARLVAIAAQDVADLTDFMAKNPAPVTLLSDESRAVIQAYDTYNRMSIEGFNLAHPGVTLIDPAGVVRWSYVGSNQLEWPQTRIVAEKLAGLQAADAGGA